LFTFRHCLNFSTGATAQEKSALEYSFAALYCYTVA